MANNNGVVNSAQASQAALNTAQTVQLNSQDTMLLQAMNSKIQVEMEMNDAANKSSTMLGTVLSKGATKLTEIVR